VPDRPVTLSVNGGVALREMVIGQASPAVAGAKMV
jgi:hypothetical protein